MCLAYRGCCGCAQNQVKYLVDEVAGFDQRRVKLRSGRTVSADILVVACAPHDQMSMRLAADRLLIDC